MKLVKIATLGAIVAATLGATAAGAYPHHHRHCHMERHHHHMVRVCR